MIGWPAPHPAYQNTLGRRSKRLTSNISCAAENNITAVAINVTTVSPFMDSAWPTAARPHNHTQRHIGRTMTQHVASNLPPRSRHTPRTWSNSARVPPVPTPNPTRLAMIIMPMLATAPHDTTWR